MPEWFTPALALIGTTLVVIGGIVGSLLTNGAAKRAARTASTVAKKDGEHRLIDQLQEELNRYRTAADARATAQDARMTRYDGLVDGYRGYAHELRSHIFDRKEPPPPPWPNGLPR